MRQSFQYLKTLFQFIFKELKTASENTPQMSLRPRFVKPRNEVQDDCQSISWEKTNIHLITPTPSVKNPEP